MNGFPQVNGLNTANTLNEMNQEPQENNVNRIWQDATEAGPSVTMTVLEEMTGPGRTQEKNAISGSISGTAALPGAWGK